MLSYVQMQQMWLKFSQLGLEKKIESHNINRKENRENFIKSQKSCKTKIRPNLVTPKQNMF